MGALHFQKNSVNRFRFHVQPHSKLTDLEEASLENERKIPQTFHSNVLTIKFAVKRWHSKVIPSSPFTPMLKKPFFDYFSMSEINSHIITVTSTNVIAPRKQNKEPV